MFSFKNLIVIGASAGGIPAIKKLIADFSPQLDVALLVVLHVSRKSDCSIIASGFQRYTALKCRVAEEGMEIQKGHLYLAPADHHLMAKGNHLRIHQGAHENKYRPSIDVLFRSAAVNYGNRVIGIVLTGLLEDGTSGMSAIHRTAGICIVQDPSEADFPDMPRSVMNKIEVDHIVSVQHMAALIETIVNQPLPAAIPIPQELQIEADITERMMSDIDKLKKIGEHSDFTCPDCGGGLWALKNDPVHRYRCHTGHVYTEKLLQELQDDNIEESVWVSIRMLEEKANLIKLLQQHQSDREEQGIATVNQKRLDDTNKHIERLKSFLTKLTEDRNQQTPPSAY